MGLSVGRYNNYDNGGLITHFKLEIDEEDEGSWEQVFMVPFEQDAWEQIMKAVPGQPLFDPALAVPSSDEESEGDQAEDAVDANEEQGNTQGTAGTINFHVPEL